MGLYELARCAKDNRLTDNGYPTPKPNWLHDIDEKAGIVRGPSGGQSANAPKPGATMCSHFNEPFQCELCEGESMDHAFTISDARDHVYAVAFGTQTKADFVEHLKTCQECQSRVAMIQRTDKGLSGELA